MAKSPIVVIGAGVGGMVAAIELALTGRQVLLLEREDGPGGKMRGAAVDGALFDVGPTVLTMRWVFDQLFARAGTAFTERIQLEPLEVLARHAWSQQERLDLFADPARSREAIAKFAGAREAAGFERFSRRSAAIFETLRRPFMEQACASPLTLMRRVGLAGLGGLTQIAPFTAMHDALKSYFHDPRLLQLFGRYATYCGSSPYLAPATLMLVAHVEQCGVFAVGGGMAALSQALSHLALEHGVEIRYRCEVEQICISKGVATGVITKAGERIHARAVVVNADAQALALGHFGSAASQAVAKIRPEQRSLSAVTWAFRARAAGFPLLRHNVFFSTDYAAEFTQIQKRREVPVEPTVYVCAEDRVVADTSSDQPERLFCLINAPADGDRLPLSEKDLDSCLSNTMRQLERCGLNLDFEPAKMRRSDPSSFDRQYPATGGALYGRASHGWNASFQRPAARTRISQLYLCGGSIHPGPGVPMAAQSGSLAARTLIEDQVLTGTSAATATAGGISMRSATTAKTHLP